MGSGDITDISIVTIVGIDIVRICGFYVIVERYRRQLLLSGTISSPDTSTDLLNKYLHSLLEIWVGAVNIQLSCRLMTQRSVSRQLVPDYCSIVVSSE